MLLHTKSWGIQQNGGENLEGNVRTTVYLERDAKRLVDEEVKNFSQWVNEKIYTSLSCESVEDVLAKVNEHEGSIKTLKDRLKDLEARKSQANIEGNLETQALAELREYFEIRMEKEMTREENLSWILAPKNIGRCKLLGKSPENMLDELEAWNDGKEKSKHSEN